ncbi:transmembrane protein-like, partial [Tropilaelaps mercedesae]
FSEVLFKVLANKGLVPVVPYGDALLFSAGLAGHSFLLNELDGKDPLSSALKFLVGSDEFLSSSSSRCRHEGSCCVLYGLRGFVKPFLIGYLGRSLFASATSVPAIVSNPLSLGPTLRDIFTSRAYVRQGIFLGGAVSTFRLVRCLLRDRGLEERTCRAIAGAIAGPWFLASRSTSIALHLFWKVVENYYMVALKRGIAPRIFLGTELIYTLSTAFILFNAVMEPHNVRPSYLRFLNNITGTGLARVNRHPIEMLGFHSTSCNPDYFPYDINLSKVHPKFIEQVVIWS